MKQAHNMYFDDGQDEGREMMVIIPQIPRKAANQLPPKTRFLLSDSQQAAMAAYKCTLEKQPRVDQRARYDESTIEQLSGGVNNRGICRVRLRGGEPVVVKGIPDNDIRCVYEPFILQVGLGPHPNIIRLRNVFYASTRGEIVLEFESCAHNLLNLILNTEMTPQKIRAIALQLLNGVRYLTEKLVIHCDLKPENIFVSETGAVKIGDFGIACILPAADHHPPVTFNVNPTGHKPPEILLMLPWGFGVDVFSLGCTLATICGVRVHPLLFRDDCSIQQHLDHILTGFGASQGPSYELLPPWMTYDRNVSLHGSVHQYVSFSAPRNAFYQGRTHDPFAYIKHAMGGDDSFYILVCRMLEPDPAKRITIAAASLWVGSEIK